jgi:organic hydroperoxide reductase OsmC/OhrA
MKQHTYNVSVEWTGNSGEGTKTYTSYSRSYSIGADGKPKIEGSSDPAFRGDPSRYNPEDLLVASLSACHMLWYLHLCATHGVVVTQYQDSALGAMKLEADGSGRFVRAELRPKVNLAPGSDPVRAANLHSDAHRMCFIAHSVNFPVEIIPNIVPAGN